LTALVVAVEGRGGACQSMLRAARGSAILPVIQAQQRRDHTGRSGILGLFLPAVVSIAVPAWEAELRGPLFTIVYAALIVACAFFYTAFLTTPTRQPKAKKHGAVPTRYLPRRAHGRAY
jgi:hypothetical protein